VPTAGLRYQLAADSPTNWSIHQASAWKTECRIAQSAPDGITRPGEFSGTPSIAPDNVFCPALTATLHRCIVIDFSIGSFSNAASVQKTLYLRWLGEARLWIWRSEATEVEFKGFGADGSLLTQKKEISPSRLDSWKLSGTIRGEA